jgi:acyl-homoserine-lactone acylase
MRPPFPSLRALLLGALCLTGQAAPASAQRHELARQVEIRRTAYGVPHIGAENLRAAGLALGYVQAEDYGERVVRGLARARGELSLHFGADSVDADAASRRTLRRAQETYHLLGQDTRDVLEGFAEGVNRYVELHPGEFPEWMRLRFTAHHVHALGVTGADVEAARRLALRVESGQPAPPAPERDADEGSNAWAFAPSRTRSGKAILLRNPHLAWTAGYYEAHLTVPGTLNFYGDFRVGSPIGIIGGFNEHLGWSTTNNDVDSDELYVLDADPARPDHYLFDGGSVPLQREEVVVPYRAGEGVGHEVRDFWSTPLGPVVHRTPQRVYVLKAAGDGEYRAPEQFLRMMQATSLERWKEAMRMQARSSSNFTYADVRGNIFYVWNATLPVLPHAPGGDTTAIPARRSSEVWTRLVPFDSLPQLLNPRGGYLHNENDSPHYANLNQVLDASRYPANHEQPRLRLRSQLALELIHNRRRLTLEEVVRLKHSPRMLLADRVKDELVAAVRGTAPDTGTLRAIGLIEKWDNTTAPGSRGGVLFETWWRRYESRAGGEAFREPWTAREPTTTPRGLAHPERAAEAFAWAVQETQRRYGTWDVAWGDVHRVRRGEVDLPVAGCSGALGCFRVLTFREDPDGRRVVNGGDGWVLAVEFGSPPRAYSVLAYGQSPRPDSPYHADQAAMFARGEMKRVVFTEADVERETVRRYRPGER